jgi:hypothetical protein
VEHIGMLEEVLVRLITIMVMAGLHMAAVEVKMLVEEMAE